MSEPTSIEPGASPRVPDTALAWSVRQATGRDAARVAAGVGDLLVELGGKRPADDALEAEARALLEDPAVGVVFVAEVGEEVIGILAASWTRAMHVPGRYVVIQDLWVHPDWRSKAIGAELVAALAAFAPEQGATRIEVGLPRESFAAIRATETFYLRNGFEELGPRMRRVLE